MPRHAHSKEATPLHECGQYARAGRCPRLAGRSDYAGVTPGMSGPAADVAGRGALASVIMDVTCRASSSGTVTVGTSASGSSLIGAAEGVTLSNWYPVRAPRVPATTRSVMP